jgi:hypothetical protein
MVVFLSGLAGFAWGARLRPAGQRRASLKVSFRCRSLRRDVVAAAFVQFSAAAGAEERAQDQGKKVAHQMPFTPRWIMSSIGS